MVETPEYWIRQRSQQVEHESIARLDVTPRVMDSIARLQTPQRGVDKTPLLFGGGLAAVGVVVIVVCLPSVVTLTEPWIGFWWI